jgi:hypothetical protein
MAHMALAGERSPFPSSLGIVQISGDIQLHCRLALLKLLILNMRGGEGGIRTPDTLSSMPDFESGAFNRALPPLRYVFSFLDSWPKNFVAAATFTLAMTHRHSALRLVAEFQVKFTSPAAFTHGIEAVSRLP